MEIYWGGMEMNGFLKFLSSSKYQLALLTFGFIVWLIASNKISGELAVREVVKLSIAYFGARVLEPFVEFLLNRRKQ